MHRRHLLALAVVAFVALGSHNAFGVAWPSAAGDLSLPVGELGFVIAVSVSGYFLSTATSGAVAARIGSGRMLNLAAWLMVVALAGYAAAPGRGVLLAAAGLLGFGSGYVDAGINSHVALRHGARAMGMLHAGFGIGSAVGPLMITLLLSAGLSWRFGYWLLAAGHVVVAGLLMSAAGDWTSSPPRPPSVDRGRLPGLAWWAMLVFLLYAAVEITTGQWAFTLLTAGRGASDTVAGIAVTGFYGGLTASRLLLGGFGHRLPVAGLSSLSAMTALAGLILVWWGPLAWVAPAALVLTGFALGPVFPLQTLMTPSRVGAETTSAMVGYQIAAASLGAILLPALVGFLVDRSGVAVIAPTLVVAATGLVLADVVLRRSGRGITEVRAA